MKISQPFRVANAYQWLIAACALFASQGAQASLLVKDSIVTNGTSSYALGVSLASQAATNGTVGVSGAWGSGTGVFLVDATSLAYPTGILFDKAGGSLAVFNSGTSAADGRILTRTISGLPTSGSIFYSALLRAGTGFVSALPNGNAVGVGLGTLASNGTLSTPRPPDDGVYFAFQNTNNTKCVVGRVKGVTHVLVTNAVDNQTYFCVAKIELGAGSGGQDIVSLSADPAVAGDFDVVTTNTVLTAGTTFSKMGIAGAYAINSKKAFFDEFRVGSSWNDVALFADNSYPVFTNAPTVSVDGNHNFIFSATLDEGAANTAVIACYGTTQGSETVGSWNLSKLVTDAPTMGAAATTMLDNLATNTSYYYAALGTNQNYSVLKTGSTFLVGEVWATLGQDAQEDGLVPGTLVVHRPDSATQAPITVNYTVGGTAVAGVNYVAGSLSSSVTIPAGQASATVSVPPLVEVSNLSDTTVVFTLIEGPYYIGSENSATVTIQNYDYPADKNCWVGSGNASVAANWTQGVPKAGDNILLGVFSSADMTWDVNGVNGLTDTVASWTQDSYYTGTVTFPINYTNVVGATFTNFTVTGDAVVNNGKWTHPANADVQSNRLCLAVGGNFTLGTNATIALLGKGFQYGKFHTGSAIATHAASPQGNHAQVYGNVYEPTELGSGGDSANSAKSYGGGAVHLAVAGSAVVDGTIDVRSSSQKTSGNNPEKGCGAGGSVYLSATSISGSGSINASCYDVAETCYSYNGSGGRVALIATSGSVSLPLANLKANGGSAGNSAGGGTIFIKNATDANGTLLVGNNQGNNWSYISRHPKKTSCTAVRPGETWTFDRILLRDQGVLSIPATATLDLAGGCQSVSNLTSTTDPQAGILYLGGTLNIPAAAEHQITGKWVFQADTPYTFNGGVRISNYAAFGNLLLAQDYPTNAPVCDITVDGNLAITSSGFLYGPGRGVRSGVNTLISYHGGIASGSANTLAYDSILNPVYPGNNGQSGDAGNTNPGGGMVKVTVTGTLTLDGSATVAPVTKNSGFNCGSGGTLSITAGFLKGSGSMTANGTAGSSTSYSGAGGRIAVRLTGTGATFDEFGVLKINAKGGTHSSGTASLMASAGTVYLQTGEQAERAGTLIVRNTGDAANTAVTPIPSTRWGGENDVLDAASLSIEAAACVKLTKSFKMGSATVASGSSIDLNGYTLTLKGMTIGTVRIAPGTYPASYFASGVTDSSAGATGALTVLGEPSLISIR